MEFCKCGSIKEFGVCSNRKCPELNNKFTNWIINGAEVKFKEPVTYSEACELAKDKVKFKAAIVPTKNRFTKVYTG